MSEKEVVIETAERILSCEPSAVVRYKLLRDVLHLPERSSELKEAKKELWKSEGVRKLEVEQWDDGSFGRFHSADTSAKQKIPTTEAGVERALALGLDASHPSLKKTTKYLEKILGRRIEFPDPPEFNNRWETGKKLFAASTLSLIDPENKVIDEALELWIELAKRIFKNGRYDPDTEVEAHRELTGASVKNSYLVISSRYQLALLGSRPGTLPANIEQAMLKWIWTRREGIGYLSQDMSRPPQCEYPLSVEAWLRSLEILMRFPRWRKHARDAGRWLWSCPGEDGLWDFGARSGAFHYFPLSDNWRKAQDRRNDWSTRVLIILGNYYNT